MEIRQANFDELPELKERLKESGGERIDLDSARVWVAVRDGEIVGMLSARLCWQLEPLLLFEGSRMQKCRAGIGLYRAAERWLADKSKNRTGIHWFFAITRSEQVMSWAKKLGWFEQYVGAKTYLRYL